MLVSLISDSESMSNSNSIILKTADISVKGSQVDIDCSFTEKCALASCVLIYREYGNASLTVLDYNRSTMFPVNVSIEQPENFTFALFGKNCEGIIEERPAKKLKLNTINPSGKLVIMCSGLKELREQYIIQPDILRHVLNQTTDVHVTMYIYCAYS